MVNETSEDVWFDNMMVMSVSSAIIQETHYDPWGLELTGLGYQYGGIKANKYLYQGKEMMDDHNLNIYDFEARGYDPVIGRTIQMDPHAESYYNLSPYSWVANNPLSVIDPTGMDTVNVNNLDMRTFNPDVDVVGLDEVVVSASGGSDEPADATRENIPIWLLREGDKVMGHRDGISGLEDFFGKRTYGPFDVNAQGRIIGLTPTTGVGPDVGRGGAARGGKWIYGRFKTFTKWANQLAKRGWTEKQITEAITRGKTFSAINNVNKANAATRYVHPTTGQSVVVDDVTKELLHVGGPGFKY